MLGLKIDKNDFAYSMITSYRRFFSWNSDFILYCDKTTTYMTVKSHFIVVPCQKINAQFRKKHKIGQ